MRVEFWLLYFWEKIVFGEIETNNMVHILLLIQTNNILSFRQTVKILLNK